jgi:hypothetical protein
MMKIQLKLQQDHVMKSLLVTARNLFSQVYLNEAAVFLLSILGLSFTVSWGIEQVAKEIFRISLV